MPSLQYYKRIFNAYLFNKKQSNLAFWHTPLSVNSLEEEDLKAVRKYPQNFSEKTNFKGKVDENSVMLLNYFGNIGYQYNPNAIAQIGLGYYDLFLTNAIEEYRQRIITNANWFLSFGRTVANEVLLWEYNFPFEMRQKLQKPWRSALAQGQAISLLLRAHIITGDNRYTAAAHRGYNAFRYEGLSHDGGVLSTDKEGNTWLEEVIIDPPNHILNGFIWALWGVYEYAKFFNDKHAKQLFESCLSTLHNNLHHFDLGYWTCYDFVDKNEPTMIVSHYYQNLHATQMLGCYNITNNDIFLEYYKKWKKYLNSPYCRTRALLEKIYFKLRYF